MGFVCIHGSYRFANRDAMGAAALRSAGDCVQFRPDNEALLVRLKRIKDPYHLTEFGAVNLRMEGIDALEIDYTPSVKGARPTHQPQPLADESRAALRADLGLNGARGFILARALDVHGRPVSFLFVGKPVAANGTKVHLDVGLLRKSLNWRQIAAGNAYPIFYETLFKDLRDALGAVTARARAAHKGLWSSDLSRRGLSARDQSELERIAVFYPKVFRRIAEYFASGGRALAEFIDWLAENEARSDPVMAWNGNFTHLDNVLQFRHGKLSLKQHPEQLVFISRRS